jgi:DsbC/DsbD-like thiol-disulfide interchange protein
MAEWTQGLLMKSSSRRLAAACAGLLLCAAAPPAPTAGRDTAPATVLLVAAPPGGGRAAPAWLALQFDLEPGWHIYWRNPGDSGGPPDVRWTLPAGLSAGPLRWPAPERIITAGIVNYGYHGRVLLPAELRPASAWPATPFTVRAQVKWLACRDICLPGKADVSLVLPAKMALPPSAGSEIRAALERLPARMPPSWKASASDTKDAFVVEIDTGRRESAADFFPAHPAEIDAAASVRVAPRERGLTLTLRKSEFLSQLPRSLAGLLVMPGGRVYDIDLPLSHNP